MKNAESELKVWASSPTNRAAFLAWLVVVLVGTSCGRAPAVHYYTLRMPPPPPAGDSKTNFVLGVEQFRANEVLRDDRILYYESPTQLGFYQQHRWTADVTTMLSESTQRQLDQTGVFAQVRLEPFREPVDYLVKGRVLSFEEVDEQGGVKGRVGLELILLRSRDHKAVWAARRQVESAVRERGVLGVVNALDAATKQILDELIPRIVAQVESDFQASNEKSAQ